MNVKKIQFGYQVPVVGVRWPSGKVTMIQGSKPLTLREVRRLLSLKNIRALKRAVSEGTTRVIAGAFTAPVGWDGWNAGI